MKTALYISLILLTILVVFIVYAKKNIEDNISGKFNSFKITNLGGGLLTPKADVRIKFDIINNSNYNFTLQKFKVKIYDGITEEYLTENIVKQELKIPKGTSTHDILLKDNKIIVNLQNFLEGKTQYLAIVSFKILGVEIEFEQKLEL